MDLNKDESIKVDESRLGGSLPAWLQAESVRAAREREAMAEMENTRRQRRRRRRALTRLDLTRVCSRKNVNKLLYILVIISFATNWHEPPPIGATTATTMTTPKNNIENNNQLVFVASQQQQQQPIQVHPSQLFLLPTAANSPRQAAAGGGSISLVGGFNQKRSEEEEDGFIMQASPSSFLSSSTSPQTELVGDATTTTAAATAAVAGDDATTTAANDERTPGQWGDEPLNKNSDDDGGEQRDEQRIPIDVNRQQFVTHDQLTSPLLNASTKDENISLSTAPSDGDPSGGPLWSTQRVQSSRAGMSKVSHVSSLLSDLFAYATRPRATQAATATQEEYQPTSSPQTSTGSLLLTTSQTRQHQHQQPASLSSTTNSQTPASCPGICRSIITATILCRNEINAPCPSFLQKCCDKDDVSFNGTPVETSAPLSPSDIDPNSAPLPDSVSQAQEQSTVDYQATVSPPPQAPLDGFSTPALAAVQRHQHQKQQQQQPIGGDSAADGRSSKPNPGGTAATGTSSAALELLLAGTNQPPGSSVYFLSSSSSSSGSGNINSLSLGATEPDGASSPSSERALEQTPTAAAPSPPPPIDGKQQVHGVGDLAQSSNGPDEHGGARFKHPASQSFDSPLNAAERRERPASQELVGSSSAAATTTTPKPPPGVVVLQTVNGTILHQPAAGYDRARRPIYYANWTDYHMLQHRRPHASSSVVYHSNIDPVKKFAGGDGDSSAAEVMYDQHSSSSSKLRNQQQPSSSPSTPTVLSEHNRSPSSSTASAEQQTTVSPLAPPVARPQATSTTTTTTTTSTTTTAAPPTTTSGQQSLANSAGQSQTASNGAGGESQLVGTVGNVLVELLDSWISGSSSSQSNTNSSPQQAEEESRIGGGQQPTTATTTRLGADSTDQPLSSFLGAPESSSADGASEQPHNDRRLGFDLSFRQQQPQQNHADPSTSFSNRSSLSGHRQQDSTELGGLMTSDGASEQNEPGGGGGGQSKCTGYCTIPLFTMLCDSTYPSPDCGPSQKCCVVGKQPGSGSSGGNTDNINDEPDLQHQQQASQSHQTVATCRGPCLPIYHSSLCTKPNELQLDSPGCLPNFVCCTQPTIADGTNHIEDLEGMLASSDAGQAQLQATASDQQQHLLKDNSLFAALMPPPPFATGNAAMPGNQEQQQQQQQLIQAEKANSNDQFANSVSARHRPIHPSAQEITFQQQQQMYQQQQQHQQQQSRLNQQTKGTQGGGGGSGGGGIMSQLYQMFKSGATNKQRQRQPQKQPQPQQQQQPYPNMNLMPAPQMFVDPYQMQQAVAATNMRPPSVAMAPPGHQKIMFPGGTQMQAPQQHNMLLGQGGPPTEGSSFQTAANVGGYGANLDPAATMNRFISQHGNPIEQATMQQQFLAPSHPAANPMVLQQQTKFSPHPPNKIPSYQPQQSQFANNNPSALNGIYQFNENGQLMVNAAALAASNTAAATAAAEQSSTALGLGSPIGGNHVLKQQQQQQQHPITTVGGHHNQHHQVASSLPKQQVVVDQLQQQQQNSGFTFPISDPVSNDNRQRFHYSSNNNNAHTNNMAPSQTVQVSQQPKGQQQQQQQLPVAKQSQQFPYSGQALSFGAGDANVQVQQQQQQQQWPTATTNTIGNGNQPVRQHVASHSLDQQQQQQQQPQRQLISVTGGNSRGGGSELVGSASTVEQVQKSNGSRNPVSRAPIAGDGIGGAPSVTVEDVPAANVQLVPSSSSTANQPSRGITASQKQQQQQQQLFVGQKVATTDPNRRNNNNNAVQATNPIGVHPSTAKIAGSASAAAPATKTPIPPSNALATDTAATNLTPFSPSMLSSSSSNLNVMISNGPFIDLQRVAESGGGKDITSSSRRGSQASPGAADVGLSLSAGEQQPKRPTSPARGAQTTASSIVNNRQQSAVAPTIVSPTTTQSPAQIYDLNSSGSGVQSPRPCPSTCLAPFVSFNCIKPNYIDTSASCPNAGALCCIKEPMVRPSSADQRTSTLQPPHLVSLVESNKLDSASNSADQLDINDQLADDESVGSPPAVLTASGGSSSSSSSNQEQATPDVSGPSSSSSDEPQQQSSPGKSSFQATSCGLPGSAAGRRSSGQAKGRVMGGFDAKPGHWCWQAALMNGKNEYLCGGALIGTKWVLTAAHCITQHLRSENQLYVRLGQHNLNSTQAGRNAKTILVKTSYVHHNHNGITLDNDIALLRLDEAVELEGQDSSPSICLVCLPERSTQMEPGKRCTVTGYGFETESGPAALRVRQSELPIVADQECQNKTSAVLGKPFQLPASSFCAGGELGQDACHGDGGSPLSCLVDGYYELTGIVSWGYKCGSKDLPGLYSKVSAFVGWINQIVSVNN